jgi:hypothetical protein
MKNKSLLSILAVASLSMTAQVNTKTTTASANKTATKPLAMHLSYYKRLLKLEKK